eukprot:TRINITY_DN19102_c0_g3_i7.p1 TRINITY_DN19102_c0_g3~~TRINITY_DN19102_c0_g3_i7.p1  ORF type:complete len:545 (-),score=12.04 TRINITY_DN19102_c0_g3_i7:58-1692(-)
MKKAKLAYWLQVVGFVMFVICLQSYVQWSQEINCTFYDHKNCQFASEQNQDSFQKEIANKVLGKFSSQIIDNNLCFQLPLISTYVDNLQIQQVSQLQDKKHQPRLPFFLTSTTNQSSVYYCQLFTHDCDNCKIITRKDALSRGLHVPFGWDWRAYMNHYPEIIEWANGEISEEVALQHYNAIGKYETRIARKINMVLRYTACGNLAEQLYSHMAAITLATLTGAKLIFSPHIIYNENNELEGFSQEDILDMEHIIQYWKLKGVYIETNDTQSSPGFDNPDAAFIQDYYEGFGQYQYLQMRNFYRSTIPLLDVLYRIKRDMLYYYMQATIQNTFACLNGMVVDLPCTQFALDSQTTKTLYPQIAQSLKFSKNIYQLAFDIQQQISQMWTNQYNSIHLDLQVNMHQIQGGFDAYLDNFFKMLKLTQFNLNSIIYLKISMQNQQGKLRLFEKISRVIKSKNLAQDVTCKEQLLGYDIYSKLDQDMGDAVDMLVILNSTNFVGLRQSSFSFLSYELRRLQQESLGSSKLVNIPKFGQTQILEKGGVLS